jgi:hypothetical protein
MLAAADGGSAAWAGDTPGVADCASLDWRPPESGSAGCGWIDWGEIVGSWTTLT